MKYLVSAFIKIKKRSEISINNLLDNHLNDSNKLDSITCPILDFLSKQFSNLGKFYKEYKYMKLSNICIFFSKFLAYVSSLVFVINTIFSFLNK
jgi:hypothetical protein